MRITILLLIINFFCVITTMTYVFTGPYNKLLMALIVIFWLIATVYDTLSRSYSSIDFTFGEPIGGKDDTTSTKNSSSYNPNVKIEPTVKKEINKPIPVEDETDEEESETDLIELHEPKKPL